MSVSPNCLMKLELDSIRCELNSDSRNPEHIPARLDAKSGDFFANPKTVSYGFFIFIADTFGIFVYNPFCVKKH